MLRSTTAACACLLAALLLQAPAAGSGVVQSPADGPHSGQGKPSSPSRGSGSRPGSGADLLDDNRRWAWWNDSEVKRELGLTEATVEAINTIFRDRFQTWRPKSQEFNREREKLNRMLGEPGVSEASFELQVMKVDRLRSELETGRTMMLFRMMRQLRPDQVKKLEEIARARANRDRGPGPGR